MCRRNTIEPPVVCIMLEKLITEMQSVSVPVVNRRYTSKLNLKRIIILISQQLQLLSFNI